MQSRRLKQSSTLITILLCLFSAKSENGATLWSLDTDHLNNPKASVVIWFKTYRSITLCLSACTFDSSCMSAFFHPQRSECMGSSSYKLGLPAEKKEDPGWVYYTRPVIRLVGGANNHEGRVEVYYNGAWGTVCDDAWDNNDAKVVCRMLGHSTTGVTAIGNASFGQNTNLDIFLDDVECLGNEISIYDCIHKEWKIHNCGHNEDAGVLCKA